MTARSPLWYNSGDLQEMTSAEIVEWQEAAIFVYAQNPTAVLSIVSGSGNGSCFGSDSDLLATSPSLLLASVVGVLPSGTFVQQNNLSA